MMSLLLMSFTVAAAVCLLSVSLVKGVPLPELSTKSLQENENGHNPDFAEEGDFFEGDIILLPDQLSYIKDKRTRQTGRTLISDPAAIWPNKTVFYEFAPGEFGQEQQIRIQQALRDLMSVSCVMFVERSTQPTYVLLRNNALGCAAAVGYHAHGPLDLYLGGPSCQTRGTIQHELLHALGFWHEHTRPDRDLHISIVWTNIYPGKEFNFQKRNPSEIMTLNMPYDYGSVMHYRSIAFSKDMSSATIIPRVPSAALRMGQRIRFSQVDLAKLNRLYQCPPRYYRGDDIEGKAAVLGDIEEDLDVSDAQKLLAETPVVHSGGKINLTMLVEANYELKNRSETNIDSAQSPTKPQEYIKKKSNSGERASVNRKNDSILEKQMKGMIRNILP